MCGAGGGLVRTSDLLGTGLDGAVKEYNHPDSEVLESLSSSGVRGPGIAAGGTYRVTVSARMD